MMNAASTAISSLDERNTEIDFVPFLRVLDRAGFIEYVTTFDPINPNPELWRRYRNRAAPPAALFIDFLLLNRRVSVAQLDERTAGSWRVLEASGVVTAGALWAQMNSFSMHCCYGLLCLISSFSSDPLVYFGSDTLGLLTRLVPTPEDRVLDLCSGSGIQALFCARTVASATAVEVNPETRRITQFNAMLNGLTSKIKILGGSLYENVSGVYDLIISNPPLVPFPDQLVYPFVGHGGADGFVVTRKILLGLKRHLAPAGRCHIVGLAPATERGLTIEDEVQVLANEHQLDVSINVIRRDAATPGSPLFEGLVATASPVGRTGSTIIRNALERMLQDSNAQHMSTFHLLVSHGTGIVSYQNLSRAQCHNTWHVLS